MIRIAVDADGPRLIAHEVVVNDLVNAAIVARKPVVDRGKVADDATVNAGLFGDLAQRRLLRGLRTLQVALGQAPLDAARPVAPGDQRGIGNSVTYVNNNATRAGFGGNRQVGAAYAHRSGPTRGSGHPGSAVN